MEAIKQLSEADRRNRDEPPTAKEGLVFVCKEDTLKPLFLSVLALLVAANPASAAAPAASRRRDDPPPRTEAADRAIPDDLKFANGLYAQRRYDLAAEEFEKLLLSNPPADVEADALFGLANSRLLLAQYQEARTRFRDFADRFKSDVRYPDAIYRIGETSLLLGEIAPASGS